MLTFRDFAIFALMLAGLWYLLTRRRAVAGLLGMSTGGGCGGGAPATPQKTGAGLCGGRGR